jgi:hypothetical protein
MRPDADGAGELHRAHRDVVRSAPAADPYHWTCPLCAGLALCAAALFAIMINDADAAATMRANHAPTRPVRLSAARWRVVCPLQFFGESDGCWSFHRKVRGNDRQPPPLWRWAAHWSTRGPSPAT